MGHRSPKDLGSKKGSSQRGLKEYEPRTSYFVGGHRNAATQADTPVGVMLLPTEFGRLTPRSGAVDGSQLAT